MYNARFRLHEVYESFPEVTSKYEEQKKIVYLLIWSMAPAQNCPKNFLAPKFLRSTI